MGPNRASVMDELSWITRRQLGVKSKLVPLSPTTGVTGAPVTRTMTKKKKRTMTKEPSASMQGHLSGRPRVGGAPTWGEPCPRAFRGLKSIGREPCSLDRLQRRGQTLPHCLRASFQRVQEVATVRENVWNQQDPCEGAGLQPGISTKWGPRTEVSTRGSETPRQLAVPGCSLANKSPPTLSGCQQ